MYVAHGILTGNTVLLLGHSKCARLLYMMVGVCGVGRVHVFYRTVNLQLTSHVLLIHDSNCLCLIICDSYVPLVIFVLEW